MLHTSFPIPKTDKKPLLRWTAGNVSWNGLDVLKESIRLFKRIYKDEFDLVVCWNNLSKDKLNFVRNLGVETVNQELYANTLKIEPIGALWALLPPRLNLDGYELCMDNDIVITKRMPHIDEWLSSDSVIYTRSYKVDKGRPCNYGNYKRYVKSKHCINSGFFGLPPGLDFHKEVNYFIGLNKKNTYNHHNFQGITASILSRYHTKVVVSKRDIELCRRQRRDLHNWMGNYGTHFITVNGDRRHLGWEVYKKKYLK